MSYGYSQRIVNAVNEAETDSLGVALGKLCIRHDIPVSVVANDIGVSRMTVYKWFDGSASPSPFYAPRIEAWMQRVKKRLNKK